jgi:flagellar biosynthesis GTPase FlhF
MITAEEGYIFTNDLEYLSSRTDIIPKSDPKAPAQAKSAEMIFVNEIRSRIDSYFKLVVRNVRDSVPKVIGYFLVRTIMDKLQLELYEQINHSESIINRLSEPPTIAAERESLKKQLETLRKAEKILKHNPEFARQTDNIAKELEEQEANYKREQEEKKSGKKEEKKEVREERVHVEEKKKEEPQAPPEKPAENKMFTSQASPPEKNMFGAAKPEVKAAGMFGPTIAKTGSNFFAGK